jgi:hypothetical protein
MRLTTSALTALLGLTASAHAQIGTIGTSDVVFYDLGTALSATGEVNSGADLAPITAHLDAWANVAAVCDSPGGRGTRYPVKPPPLSVTGTALIPAPPAGTFVPFSVATEPAVMIPGAPDCPNSNFTEVITDLAFTRAVLTLTDFAGQLVLICPLTPPTTNGPVPNPTCTSQ